MSSLSALISLLMVALIAVPLVVLPLRSRPSVPLGVNVPSGYERHPAVLGAKSRFSQLALVVLLISVILVFALAAWPLAGMLAPMFVCLVGITAAYVWARQGIIRAKRQGDWYADARVRVGATLTPAGRPRMQWGWYAASVLLVATGFVVGGLQYAGLPDPMPVHWGLNGQPDRFDTKSIGAVFLPMFIALGLLIVLALTARLLPLGAGSTRARGLSAGGTPRSGQTYEQLQVTIGILGAITCVTTVLVVGVAVVTWLDPQSALMTAVTIAGIGLLAVVLLIGTWAYVKATPRPTAEVSGEAPATIDPGVSTVSARSAGQVHPHRASDAGAVSLPDDDRYWKSGLVYSNRDNPALWVSKRVGIGWSINLGHPAAWWIIAGFVVFIAASLTVPLLFS